MKSVQHHRDIASRRRRPPVMAELPAPAPSPAACPSPLAPPDPRIVFHVRAGHRVTEIASDEDWWVIDQHLGQPNLDRLEIWATDTFDGLASLRIFPNAETPAVELLACKTYKAAPDREASIWDEEDDQLPPAAGVALVMDRMEWEDRHAERHDLPTLSDTELAEAAERYNQAMGEAPTHPTPDGPVQRE